MVAECLFNTDVRDVRICLDILINTSLNIIKILLLDTSQNSLPSDFARNILNMISVDLARLPTGCSFVTLLLAVVADGWGLGRAVGSTMSLLLT